MEAFFLTLVGIINHHGNSAYSVHYTCTLFCNDKIFHCNDMMITESSDSRSVHSAMPYILYTVGGQFIYRVEGYYFYWNNNGIIME